MLSPAFLSLDASPGQSKQFSHCKCFCGSTYNNIIVSVSIVAACPNVFAFGMHAVTDQESSQQDLHHADAQRER